uniref:Uncharacterized protein n=1 Tax=Anguilla anguilla TaxID=7936 RepID=A0A0E9QY62_ANGAN
MFSTGSPGLFPMSRFNNQQRIR